jgi:hypothetical protein
VNTATSLYLRHLPTITGLLDSQKMAFYYNNALFFLSHLATDPAWEVRKYRDTLVMEAGSEWRGVLPLSSDRTSWLRVAEELAVPGKPVLRAPDWACVGNPYLHYAPLWPDYVGSTTLLQSMAGRKLKGLRQPILRLERSGVAKVSELAEKDEEEAAALVGVWYKARAPILGEMFQEKEIIWLFSSLGWLLAHVPGVFGMGVRVEERLVAVNLSCVLSSRVWVCHTERYDPSAPTYVNQLAFRDACRHIDAAIYPEVNDGAAEAPVLPGVANLASFKERLASFQVTPWGIWAEEDEEE